MIRTVAIIVLTCAALATLPANYLDLDGDRIGLSLHWEPTPHHSLWVRFAGSKLQASYHKEVDGPEPHYTRSRMGFGYVGGAPFVGDVGTYWRCHKVYCPFWIPTVVFALYPCLAFLRGPVCRWRRRKRNFCVLCGYNLTGNTSGVCPECGASVATAARAPTPTHDAPSDDART